jgi:hypothetical protein
MIKKLYLFEIEWDVDTEDEDVNLPDHVFVKGKLAERVINDPDSLSDYDDEFENYLSDTYGFCVKRFNAAIMTVEKGRTCSNCKNRAFSGWDGIEYCWGYEMTGSKREEIVEACICRMFEPGTPECFNKDDEHYCPSSTAGDYSPSSPWNAPGLSVRDFI